MIFIVDANILFSIALQPNGVVSQTFQTLSAKAIFIAPLFLQQEIAKHLSKICELTGKSERDISAILDIIFSKIIFYPSSVIPAEIEANLYRYLENHDQKDIPYLCFAIYFQCKLWTGDKKLRQALTSQGVNICVSTTEILLM